MSSEQARQEQNVHYPSVEDMQGTNFPPSEQYQKEQNGPYTKLEEVQGSNPPTDAYEEAKDRAKVEEVQGSNLPTETHGEAQDKAKVKKVKGKKHPKEEHGKAKEKAKWGTHIMGAPAAPSAHPENQEAATWTARDEDEEITPNPYLIKGETPQQPKKSPMELVRQSFNGWTKKAEDLGSNVWTNLRTGQSVPDAAWGKVSLGAKAVAGGGFESLFKQTFPVGEDEKLRKTFACYFSTSTGPVAGTLYISTAQIAFCSDRPLSYTVPSGEKGWGYYRVAVPLVKTKAVRDSVNKDKPAQKFIEVETVDNHEFWFMGFVNYEKALINLKESVPAVSYI